MPIHLMCLSSSGTPIFTKKRGENIENVRIALIRVKLVFLIIFFTFQLPFSTVASFNGVHLFCKTQNVGLDMTEFDDNELVIWKEYESVHRNCDESHGESSPEFD